VSLLTRIVADAAAEGLIQRHQKPEEGAEPAEPLAEWERELLTASETPAQSSAETEKVAGLDEAKSEADSIIASEQVDEGQAATESEADAEAAAAEPAEIAAADEAAQAEEAEEAATETVPESK